MAGAAVIRRSPLLAIILGLVFALLIAKTVTRSHVKTTVEESVPRVAKARAIEKTVIRHKDTPDDDPVKMEAQNVVESLLTFGNAGEVLTAIDLLKHFPEISTETRKAIARSLCRFQSHGDIEFELIRSKLLRDETPLLDLSACNG